MLRNLRTWKKNNWLALSLVGVLGLLNASWPGGDGDAFRSLSSMAFPRHKATSDVSDILDNYPDYLRFALEVGKDTDRRSAGLLKRRYDQLLQKDRREAARFLKGLRFEMTQKLELIGTSPDQVTTSNPMMRRWVGKFIREWAREADEYLFRAYTQQLARRSSDKEA